MLSKTEEIKKAIKIIRAQGLSIQAIWDAGGDETFIYNQDLFLFG